MAQSEIEAVRALLSSKPRPVGWPERRQRLDDVGSVWPVADDVELAAVDVNGLAGEYSIVPGSDPSCILMFFHGGGYCSGSILSHRRMASEAGRAAGIRTLAVAYRLAPRASVPRGVRRRADGVAFSAESGHFGCACCDRWRQCGRRARNSVDQPAARCARGASGLRVARIALDGSYDVWFNACQPGRRRSNHPQGLSE